jgi:hypothetical protein
MASTEHFGAACNTLAAGRIEMLLAKLFGKKYTATDKWGNDEGCTLTLYRWRGKLYLTNFARADRKGDRQ